METKLARIAELAKARPQENFTSLAHLLSKEMLEKSHRSLESGKAPGVDEIGKAEYEANLQANVEDLVGRLKRKAYRPQPVKRVYIPKTGTNKKRPLGIPAYEDKIIQYALKEILSRVYEADFLDCSCGFRPQRGCHDALQLLNEILTTKQVNYIVDADIKGFFDHVDHEWMMEVPRPADSRPKHTPYHQKTAEGRMHGAGKVAKKSKREPRKEDYAKLCISLLMQSR